MNGDQVTRYLIYYIHRPKAGQYLLDLSLHALVHQLEL